MLNRVKTPSRAGSAVNRVAKNRVERAKKTIDAAVEPISGTLEIMNDGQGFVRPRFTPGPRDAYIARVQIQRYNLRAGDMISGLAKAPKETEKYWALVRIESVNGKDLREAGQRPDFRDLVPVYPQGQARLETDPKI